MCTKKINHYLNAGVVIYSKSKFTQYLRMTETSKDIIHVSRGNDLLEDEDPVLGCENQEELATGMIISATSDGIDILKNCYYDNFSGLRFIDKTDSKEKRQWAVDSTKLFGKVIFIPNLGNSG